MQPVLNVDDVRDVEQQLSEAGVSLSELMHRAGAAAAQEVMNLGEAESVVVLAGFGNNGGDGWVAAEVLRGNDVSVTVVTPVEPQDIKSDLARTVATSARRAGVPVVVSPPRDDLEKLIAGADVVLDAMLGTGFRGEPRAPFDIWIDCLNASGVRVVAADVPSGLSAQTGLAVGPCVIADVTVTMLSLKPGLLADEGRDACGSIVVAPLAEQTEGIVLQEEPVAWRAETSDYLDVMLPSSSQVDKYTRGSVLVVGGSVRYPGAAIMAARSAARAGAGYVTLAVPEPLVPIVQPQLIEIPVVANKNTAVVAGPGMTVSASTVAVVTGLLQCSRPLVLDADAINCISRLTEGRLDSFPELIRRDAPLVLTPHRRELGRLVGMAENPPASLVDAMDAARRVVWADGGSELCVVAKGNATACVGVEMSLLPKPGPAALATAGSGDVLSGIVGANLARVAGQLDNESLPLLCAYACEIHAYAGSIAADRYGSRGVMATDIIDAVGLATDALEERAAYPDGAPDKQ